jgi:hypothetical protein
MKSILIRMLMILCLSIVHGYAQSGSGVRGGALIIDVDNDINLLDLNKDYICEWKTGSDLLLENPKLNDLINSIAKNHWYFALDFKQELKALNFCFTEHLFPYSLYEHYTGIKNPAFLPYTFQIGFRINETVYISKHKYEILGGHDFDEKLTRQAMTISHEVLHSYFPMRVENRALKLRSFNYFISNILRGKSVSTRQFNDSMYFNNVNFPYINQKLNNVKTELTFLKSSEEEQLNLISNTDTPEAIINLNDSTKLLIEDITSYDREAIINERNTLSVIKNTLWQMLFNIDFIEFKNKINSLKLNQINLMQLLLNNLNDLSIEKREYILSHKSLITWSNKWFDQILNEKLNVENQLVQISPALATMLSGKEFNFSTPLISLDFPNRFSPKMGWLVNLIVYLNSIHKVDVVLDNENFYSVLKLTFIKDHLEVIKGPVVRENKYLKEKTELLSKFLISQLFDELNHNLKSEDYSYIKLKITQKLNQ